MYLLQQKYSSLLFYFFLSVEGLLEYEVLESLVAVDLLVLLLGALVFMPAFVPFLIED